MEIILDHLHNRALTVMLVVIDPEVAGESKSQRRKCQASGESEEIVEDGNSRGEEEGYHAHAQCATEPDGPVHE